ncbi:3-dehydroquinate synthase [Psychroflexus aestuariivivens]|uniref:3-dehydroquinate synthase n=1 Tax=Psychroflexus aestuariivivens TaxID=1795040 RepID=UPI000FD8AC86|nr:3-dehydroquinate synthase [Psychroflexus aestuariivivens]
MNSILLNKCQIIFQPESYTSLNSLLKGKSYSSVFVLVDENTHHFCAHYLLQNLETDLNIEIIEIEPGENFKTIETCLQIWQSLNELGADRSSLLINLGGGIVTDIGGFVGSTFKRGIDFVHIPTTLLGMVDASIGGKNGVNLEGLKNQIGVIRPPLQILIDVGFLATLPQQEMRSGLAEMLKHGLISDEKYFNNFEDLSNFDIEKINDFIYESIQIKTNITEKDAEEKSLRMQLNFGHTLGHAIETYCMNSSKMNKLLHGEAVAIGMILALYLSAEICNFPVNQLDKSSKIINSYFDKVDFDKNDIKEIITLLIHDKKNRNGNINFVLLENIGVAKINCQVDSELIYKAFEFYKNL